MSKTTIENYNEKKEQEIKKLRSWLSPKEVVVQEIKQQIQSQELLIKQIDENINQGFYLKQQQKEIAEQTNEASKKLHELELERINRDIESGYYEQKAKLVLEGLKDGLNKEEEIINGIRKKLTMIERNHKVEVEPKGEKDE